MEKPENKPIEYIVPTEDEGAEVKALLRQRLRISAGLMRSLKHIEGGITLDGQSVTVRKKASAGQVLRILPETAEGDRGIIPVEGPIDIVFQDGHLLVVNKPAGLAVHPSRGHYTDTLANRVAHHLGGAPFRAINRLDRGTSGLMCLGRSRYSAALLSRQLHAAPFGEGGGMERCYLAVLDGELESDRGTIDRPIARKAGMGIMREVREGGDRAVTHYEVLRRHRGRTLAKVWLETGRTHQIRVHFADLGCPVAGDFMYGREIDWLDGHGLHSWRLSFTHPVSGEELMFEADTPLYFARLMGDEPPK